MFTEDDLIYSYTRAQAIKDGVLVDVSDMARQAGFRWPVAVTQAVWATIEAVPPKLQGCQDIQGRLWDVLYMGHLAARRGGQEIRYKLIMDRNENGRRLRYLVLKALCGPGDDGEPVITIMLPEED
jgi:hypothetical protein